MKKRLLHCLACLALGLCWTVAAGASDPARPWLPVTPQDLQLKEVPGDPNAKAIQMYYADEIDDVEHDEFLYDRVKILSESGKDRADVEIPILPGTSIHELEARTIHPDGSIIVFAGNSFEKTILRGKGVKLLARIFAFPDVTVGSIIEYKYRLHRDDKSFPNQTWFVQHDLYTVKEHFWFKYDKRSGRAVAWVATPGFTGMPEQKIGAFEMQAENIPAFEKEELMPPEDGYKFLVKFYYGGHEMSSAATYWSEYGTVLSQYFLHYVGDYKEVKKVAAETTANETDPGKRLKRLYARAQEIKNLDNARQRSSQEQKKENLKNNENIEDVLKHGYGHGGDITALFVGMARAAGFDASLMMVSGRRNRLFDNRVLSIDQLDGLIARVVLGGKQVYLDPGTRFCPFGILRWTHTETAAMDLNHPGDLIRIPGEPYSSATTARLGQFNLTPEGNLKGKISLSFTGAEALEHRLAALQTDEAGRNKELEEELQEKLPSESVVKLAESSAWTAENEPLTAAFSVEIPGYASPVGKRLLLPAGLFEAKKKTRLTAPSRKYPIYLPYAYLESDKITITVPDGYSVESVPERQEAKLPYARYARTAKVDGKNLVLERVLLFNGIFIDTSFYAEFKDFFGKVNAGDESQSVLRLATVDAQKAN
jgi:hypothetical protein